MVWKILAYMIYFSPYVFCICLLAEYVFTLVNIKREKKLEEERRKSMNRAIYTLALELRRLNNRLECKACPGKEENTEAEWKKWGTDPGKGKVPHFIFHKPMQFIEMRMKKSGEKSIAGERENTDKYRDKSRYNKRRNKRKNE